MKKKILKTLLNFVACSLLSIPAIGTVAALTSCSQQQIDEPYLQLSSSTNETSFEQKNDEDIQFLIKIDTNITYSNYEATLKWTNASDQNVSQPSQIQFNESNLSFVLKSVNSSFGLDQNYICELTIKLIVEDETQYTAEQLTQKIDLLFVGQSKLIFRVLKNYNETEDKIFNQFYGKNKGFYLSIALASDQSIAIDRDSIQFSYSLYNLDTNQYENIEDPLFSFGNAIFVDNNTESIKIRVGSDSIMWNSYRFDITATCKTTSNESISSTINITIVKDDNLPIKFSKFEINPIVYLSNDDQVVLDMIINWIDLTEFFSVTEYAYEINDDIFEKFTISFDGDLNFFDLYCSDESLIQDSKSIVVDKISDIYGKEIILTLKKDVELDSEQRYYCNCNFRVDTIPGSGIRNNYLILNYFFPDFKALKN